MRVAVDAYYNNNLGDDLFLDTLINRYKNAHFDFLLTDLNSCLAFRDHPQVKFVSRKKVFLNILNYDAYIFIGGSLFQEPEDWKKQWKIFNITVSLFSFFGKSSFVLGCNFGPYRTENYKSTYIKTFKKLTHMTVRDNYSFGLLNNNGINLSVHPDIVLCKDINKQLEKKLDIVGISIIDWPNNPSENGYIDFNSDLIKFLVQKNKKVRLFAFQDTEHISDLRLINKILEKQDDSIKVNIEVISYRGDLIAFLEKYAECYSMVATRFHSLILSVKYQQNILPIIYSNKTIQTLDYLSLGIDFIRLENLPLNDIKKVADILLRGEDNYKKGKIHALEKLSDKHFSVLDKVLRK